MTDEELLAQANGICQSVNESVGAKAVIVALAARLAEVQAERNALHNELSMRDLRDDGGLPEASRGEVVPACPQWQPIDTAPKDGTVVNVWLGDADDEDVQFYCIPGTRISTGWVWKQGRLRPPIGLSLPVVTVRPTHWMPLPNPPEETI